FTRRQLLAYKIIGNLGTSLLATLFMSLFMGQFSSWFVAAYIGLLLQISFMQFFAMAVSLVGNIVDARSYNSRRQVELIVLALLAFAVLLTAGKDVLSLGPLQLLQAVEQSPVIQTVLTPLRWFVEAFLAERLWPDLMQWVALGLAVNLGLLVVVFLLDAQYLEAAATASERVYAQIQQMKSGGMAVMRRAGRVWFTLPTFPRWGGVGPIC